MVSIDKFYVYGGGRWREVDSSSGRIDGWGRARFLVARGGKLEAARSMPVLAALRALSDKKPSAAKEGPQLPHKYPRFKSRERVHQRCEHQCCHSNSGSGCTSKPNDKKASIAIQCNNVDLSTHNKPDNTTTQTTTQNSTTNEKPIISTTNKKTVNQKRKRVSTSSEELFHTKGVTMATVHSPRKPEPKRLRISSNTRMNKNESTSSNDTIKSTKKSPRLQLRRPLKRRRNSSEESIILESRLRTNQPRKIRKKSLDESLPRRSARTNTSIVISDDSDFEDSKGQRKIQNKRSSIDEPLLKVSKGSKRIIESSDVTVKRGFKNTENSSTAEIILGPKRISQSLKDEQIKHMLQKAESLSKDNGNSSRDKPLSKIKRTIGRSNEKLMKNASPKKSLESSTDEPIKSLIGPKTKLKHKLGDKKVDEKVSSQLKRSLRSRNKGNVNNSQETSKELIIDEKDVAILRRFLEKNYPDEDIIRFDTDDEYKKMHFYRINPLVNVERCPQIAKMIQDSQGDRLSLVAFASKLGLRSVSEASTVKRYRTRRRDEKVYVEDNIHDKENEKPSKSNVLHKTKAVREREVTRERDSTKDTVELNNDSGKVELKKKTKAVSKRPPLNEYSNLEDHAIVSWVSVGARACSVNGNRIWRELQGQFQRITGHERTWHSLRNRYLRYILPRLGALALPTSLQTRLRAAAATGELKAKRRGVKRNSIFKPPARGAFSRRPGLQGDQDSEREEKDNGHEEVAAPPRPRTPRYSDVTRQFAREHRYSSESSNKSAKRNITEKPNIKASLRESTRTSNAKDTLSGKSRNSRIESSNNSPSAKSKYMHVKSRKNSDVTSDSNDEHNTSKIRRKRSLSLQRKKDKSSSDSSHTDRSRSKSSDSYSSDPVSIPSDLPRRRSGRLKSLTGSPERRKSNRNNSPEPKRRKSNRNKSPLDRENKYRGSSTDSSDSSIVQLIRKSKSNNSPETKHRYNRIKSPIHSSRSNSQDSKIQSNKNNSVSKKESNSPEIRRNSRRKSNRYKPDNANSVASSQEKHGDNSSKSIKPRTRKLFNPKEIL